MNTELIQRFMKAIYHEDILLVKTLMEQLKHLNFIGYSGSSPLSKAVGTGNIELVDLLLKHGADINGAPDERWPPLHTAVDNAMVEYERCIQENNYVTQGIEPPIEMIQHLFQYHPDPGLRSCTGETILDMAPKWIALIDLINQEYEFRRSEKSKQNLL